MLYAHQIQLQFNTWTIPHICQHNIHIMELKLTPMQLAQINASCCMYLQVPTLAQITNHTGTILLPQATILAKRQKTPGHEGNKPLDPQLAGHPPTLPKMLVIMDRYYLATFHRICRWTGDSVVLPQDCVFQLMTKTWPPKMICLAFWYYLDIHNLDNLLTLFSLALHVPHNCCRDQAAITARYGLFQ